MPGPPTQTLLSNQQAKDRLAHPGATPVSGLGAKPDAFALENDDDADELSWSLNRFASTFERHEQIAFALAGPDSRCQLPYQDYVPCPGSGPGSPAVSDATDYIPPAAPIVVEPPKPEPQPSVSLADIVNAAPSPTSAASPMTRYLSDPNQGHEWLAVVLEQPSSNTATTQPPEAVPARQDSPTSSITLDGDNSADGLFLAAPSEALTPSTSNFEESSQQALDTLSSLYFPPLPMPPRLSLTMSKQSGDPRGEARIGRTAAPAATNPYEAN